MTIEHNHKQIVRGAVAIAIAATAVFVARSSTKSTHEEAPGRGRVGPHSRFDITSIPGERRKTGQRGMSCRR